jgi:excisionase family DNA binding protein
MMRRKRRRYHRTQPVATTVYVQPKPPGVRRLAKTDEACAYGKFSRRTLYRLIEKKLIKAYKRNRSTMIDLDSIDALNNTLPELNHAHG